MPLDPLTLHYAAELGKLRRAKKEKAEAKKRAEAENRERKKLMVFRASAIVGELINKYAKTCLKITTAAFDGTVEDKDYADVKKQAEDICISVLTNIAGVEYNRPVKSVTMNAGTDNEYRLSLFCTAKEGENLDAYIFPLIGKAELSDMYVFTVDTVIKLEDKNGVKNYFALFYSRARRKVLFKVFSPNGDESFLNIGTNIYSELPSDKLTEIFKSLTPVSVNAFLDDKAKEAYLSIFPIRKAEY